MKIDPTIDIKVEPEIDIKIDQKIEINEEPVYVPFGTPPKPVGGFEAIQNNEKILQSISKSGKGGRVVFQILVSEKGETPKVKITESTASKEYEKVALEVIKSVKWKPGKQRDKAVAVWVELPIEFESKRKIVK